MPATREQRREYRDQFRSHQGEMFQEWFGKLAREMHAPGDFQPIRKTSGDGGLDGYVINKRLVYQVYAPARRDELRDAETASKIKKDFQTAYSTLTGQMENWVFVHNHPGAMLGKASVAAVNQLKTENPKVGIDVLDIDSLWQRLEGLPDAVLERLFGKAPPPKPVTPEIIARALDAYRANVKQRWAVWWSDKPQLVPSQGMRLLLETDRPEQCLRDEYFRTGQAADLGIWKPIDRSDVVFNRLRDDDGTPCDLSRLVVTADAGMGKTVALVWLNFELNASDTEEAAFLLTFGQLPQCLDDLLPCVLVPELRRCIGKDAPQISPNDALAILEKLWDEGRLTLVLDGLDQAPPNNESIATFKALLEDQRWHKCRVIVSGRPYALQCHSPTLFATAHGYNWRFVKVDEFDEVQQQECIGLERYNWVAEEARDILSTPRVLECLHRLTDNEVRQIASAGDVYWLSLQHLLTEGIRNSTALAAGKVTPTVPKPSLGRARQLLGIIAFQMTREDFRNEVPKGDFDNFVARLAQRLGGESSKSLTLEVSGLATLDNFLERPSFEAGQTGLDCIQWRENYVREFFAAYWLAKHSAAEDAGLLWDWIYLPEQPSTEEYYWVWRFLCEMHKEARDKQSWSRAIASLYRPGDGTAARTKRSNEMIYRSWDRLADYVKQGIDEARVAQAGFLDEFEKVILAGNRGPEAMTAAEQFCNSFVIVPSGDFQMGSPKEKQCIPGHLKRQWKELLDRGGDPEQRAEVFMRGWSYPPTAQGQRLKKSDKQIWSGVFRDRNIDLVAPILYRTDETPREPIQQVDSFLLNRWPTLNAWYRLFDPGHGQSDSYCREQYAVISGQAETPTIFVTWYDAWVFCKWASWLGMSCRLPREYEWEYAAKAGTYWNLNYWWDDEFRADKCNAGNHHDGTTPPSSSHANPWGFEDILGNVWEWCDDEYRTSYTRDRDAPPDRSGRVLRGGSWNFDESYARSAYRDAWQPTVSNFIVGFRVARNLQ